MPSTRRLLTVAAVAVAAAVALVGANVVGADDRPTEVDVGFLQDMIDHHDQANLLSLVALRADPSPLARNLAIDVLASQRHEIGLMEGLLLEWGHDRGAPTREAMAWMGMHVTPDAMPGMASRAQIEQLSALRGAELDRRFLELMIDHHEGGIHMAEAARDDATNPHVRWLAIRMARNQRGEIREISMLLDALPAP